MQHNSFEKLKLLRYYIQLVDVRTKDLCEMKALEQCGVSQIELDKLNIKNTIIITILSKI